MNRTRSFLAVASAFAVSAAFYARLPGPYLTAGHFLALERPLVAFFLPITAYAIFALLNALLPGDVGTNHRRFEPACEAIVFRVLVFLLALHLLLMLDLTGVPWVRSWAGRGVLLLVGWLLVGVGNLLPLTKPNAAIGFRTTRTLSDRRVWAWTHRLAGYLMVALGGVFAVAGVLLGGRALPRTIGIAALAGVATLSVAYRRRLHV